MKTVMKCHIMRHFIWVYAVCQSTHLEVSGPQWVKATLSRSMSFLVQCRRHIKYSLIFPVNCLQADYSQEMSCHITFTKMKEAYSKVSKGAKIRNRYNQVPHLTQDTNGKVTNSQKTPQMRAKRSALSQQVTTKHI